MPNACIGVDVIVGFPGETREDFIETYEFINGMDISYLHVFTYSERENTVAIDMSGSVPGSDRNERNKMLTILSEKKRRYFYETQLGNDLEVLFEADQKNGYMHGFTRNYVKVKAKYDPVLVNELKQVHLVNISDDGDVEVDEVKILTY
jgi:threonylcarbamoyladenosine tRNA methylthiotransferase MtaB